MKTNAWILLLVAATQLLLCPVGSAALVFSDDMSGTYSTHWTTVIISGSGSGSFVSGELILNPNSTITQFSAQTSTTSFSSPYSSVLENNSGTVTWSFNMRTTGDLSSTGNQVAFVLGASTSDLGTGNGYAVFVGSSGTPDPFQLVRYTGGIANRTVLAFGGDFGNSGVLRGSVRVTYEPGTDTWSLFGVSGGSYVDPTTVTTQLGSSVNDSTYTSDNLSTLALWSLATASGGNRVFDNLSIEAVPEPTNIALGIFAAGLLAFSGARAWGKKLKTLKC